MEGNEGNWSDVYTAEQLVAALRVHANKIAKMHGVYSLAQDILRAAECIEDLAEQRDQLRHAGGDMIRKVLAAKESLSKLPS